MRLSKGISNAVDLGMEGSVGRDKLDFWISLDTSPPFLLVARLDTVSSEVGAILDTAGFTVGSIAFDAPHPI
jgi:hypothetical protein